MSKIIPIFISKKNRVSKTHTIKIKREKLHTSKHITNNIEHKKISRYISKSTQIIVFDRQNGKCANNPSVNMFGHQCILWKYGNGDFGLSKYQYDHFIEHAFGKDKSINNPNNIQALCTDCHAIKTQIFKNNKCKLNSHQILYDGACIMDESK